jgi:transketolase
MVVGCDKHYDPRGMALQLRRKVLEMAYCAGSGHCGGSLSCAEILSVLYFDRLNIDPGNPSWEDRDRFIASKGHCAPSLYAALAMRGFFPVEELANLRRMGHFLQGHPDMKRVPGVDMSTGSLGMGLSVGIGFALSATLSGRSYRTYVLLGDGELQEGQNWEAAMCAARFGLRNLTAIVDSNGVQLDGQVRDIMPLGDIAAKFRAFGWNAVEADGHDVDSLSSALDSAVACEAGPTVVVARTVKGKGVSFMEGRHEWHGKPLGKQDFDEAIAQLEVSG